MQQLVIKLKTVSSRSFTRTAAFIGILAAVAGPLIMLAFGGREASNLPWYIWIVVAVFLLLVIGTGYFMFYRENHDAQDISIRPRNR